MSMRGGLDRDLPGRLIDAINSEAFPFKDCLFVFG